jgi:hypothetical protein
MPEIYAQSIDEAWLRAVDAARRLHKREVSPLTVAFDVGEPAPTHLQCPGLRARLDEALVAGGNATVETVANTLFPKSLWNPSKPREHLFQRYQKILPTLRHVGNPRGLYFERMISYPGTRGTVGKNQLDHIAQTFVSGNHRRSALQAAIFYPPADLNHSRQLGFPCLHQVAFTHSHARGTLTVTAFYAMQYLFERAYGNYLGLMRLGQFMSHEMNLKLERVICIAAVAKLEVAANLVEPLLSQFLTHSKIGNARRSA